MSKRKIIVWTVLAPFVAIQFIRPNRNNDGKVPGLVFVNLYAVPDRLDQILREACYDCHSNNTRYPWYTNFQPIGWILAGHIKKGKSNINFSEFNSYSSRRQISKLKAISDQVEDNKMPLKSYKLFHKKARLSAQEKKLIITWMRNKADSILVNEGVETNIDKGFQDHTSLKKSFCK